MRRLTLLAVSLCSALALAQQPNDTCAGAMTIPTTLPHVTPLQLLAGVSTTSEAPFSCQTSSNATLWYRFNPAVTGTYVFTTCGASATLSDTIIAAYDNCAAPLELGCSDDACGLRSSLTMTMNAGTDYFIQVGKYGSTFPNAFDTMQLIVTNQASNDTCASPVPMVLDTPVIASLTPAAVNDAVIGGGAACFVGTGTSTATTAAQRDAVFSFTPPTTGLYNLRQRTLPNNGTSQDPVLYLSDSCVAAMTPPQTYTPPQCIAGANRLGNTAAVGEDLSCISLTGGVPVYVWADEGTAQTYPSTFELEVTACYPETEPNDAVATAGALQCPITANLGSTTDVDFFSLGTPAAGARVYAMIDAITSGNSGTATTDYDLRVTTATDTLEYDDSNGDVVFGGLSAAVAGTPLVAGQPNYLRVNYKTATTVGPYRLYATVQTSTPTPETEPNDTIAQANSGQFNHFTGDVTSTTDFDVYGFDARRGDLIFAAVDGQPSRSGAAATANHTLQLLDEQGNVLVAITDATTAVSNTSGAGSLTAVTPNMPADALVWRAPRTGRYFARVGRTSTTGTSVYTLSLAFNCFASVGNPVVTSATPNTGSIVGGTSVVIDGSNFSPGSQVFFGNTPVQVVAQTATQLTINTPPGVAGPVDVRVVNPGNQFSTLTAGFSYFEPIIPPTVTSVAPAVGSTMGGTTVTIDGTLFKLGAEVYFTVGATRLQATNVTVVNAVRLTATTPAHAAGLATVTVRNPVDALEGSLTNGFEFLSPPTVASTTPSTGLTSGGYSTTVAGTGFRTGATVRFGATLGTGVVVDPSGNSLTVTVPAAATNGAVNVTVTNPDGQSAVLTNGFTYTYPAPTIANVTPPSGFQAGGQTLTINGNDFLTGVTVTVGGAPATNVVRVSATRLTATTPAGAPGPADVVVTNPDSQTATLTGGYTYIAAPTVTAISPNHGPVQGGTLVTLTGTGFLPNASVSIGGVPAFAVTVLSATSATAITNGAPAGVGDVVFTNADTQRGTLPMAFTFDPAPTLVSVTPVSGSSAGGTLVTLTGTGFLAGATVLFGTDPSPAVTVASATTITAEAPMHAVGVVSISVRNSDNQLAELPRAFRYIDPPTLTAVGPNTGDVAGGTLITLTGTGFTPGSTVSLDGVAATQVAYVSATELTAFTPPHAPGMVDVVVTSDGVPATLAYGFTYTRGQPTLASVAPVSGPTSGGTLLTLTGSGFAAGATVTVGGAMATNVVIVSPVLARAVVPAHAAGTVDVVLTNDDMQAATLSAGFTYVTPPSGNMGIADGGGGLGNEPVGGGGGTGGVSCGCTSFDGSMLSLGGLGLLLVLSRRRRRS